MNHSFYNENVMKYATFVPEEYDILIDEDEDAIIYDDSDEWYNNIDESEADV